MGALEKLRKSVGTKADESLGATRLGVVGGPEKFHGETFPAADARWEGCPRDPNARLIPVDRIVPDTTQPRRHFDPEELRALSISLAERGQLQPITVYWSAELARWVIKDGERRWRATVDAGLDRVYALVDPGDPSADDVLVDQLVANCCRSELRPIEQAWAFRRVMDARRCKAHEVAELVGISKSSVSRALALLEAAGPIQDAVEAGDLAPSVAYELTKIADPAEQVAAAGRVMEGGMNREQAAEEVRRVIGKPRREPLPPAEWGKVPITGVGLPGDMARALVAAEVDTAGRAWRLLELGVLHEVEGISHFAAKVIEGHIVGLREEAGDPAPYTVVMPEVPPGEAWRGQFVGMHDGLPGATIDGAHAAGCFTYAQLDDRFAQGTTNATFGGHGGLLWSALNRIKKVAPSVYRPDDRPAGPAGEGRDVPRAFRERPEPPPGARYDDRPCPVPIEEASPVDPLPAWRQQPYSDRREQALASIVGVEILARSDSDAPPWKVLLALKDAVARVELAIERDEP